MDLDTVAGSKCGFRLISSWGGSSLPSQDYRTTDMQEIVGCRGLQRSERTSATIPCVSGCNCLKRHRQDALEGHSAVLKHSVPPAHGAPQIQAYAARPPKSHDDCRHLGLMLKVAWSAKKGCA